MKKYYLVLSLLIITSLTFGQTFILEDFSGNEMPPDGWTIEGIPAQWSVNNGAEAGGSAPEAKFTWVSGTNTSHLISPEIDLSGFSSVSFQFSHFLDDYSGSGYSIGVATRSGGGSWNDVWTVSPGGNMGPETINVEINNGDVGASDFQVSIYVSGNTYNLDYWYIDNIILFAPLATDAALTGITTSSFIGEPTAVTGSLLNFGSNQITSVTVDWQIDNGSITTTTFDGLSLDFGDSYNFTCDGLIDLPIGTYLLTVNIAMVNGATDDDLSNNVMEKNFSVVSNVVYRKVFFEQFTSSTCAPCATLNTQFVPWCEQNADDICLLKYQMNWPGSGDPYYTLEGGVRKDYYGVSAVPAMYVNGTYIGYQFSGVQPAFNDAIEMPGLLNMVSSHSLEGTEMTVNVSILPYAGFNGYILHIAIFEYLTTQNVGSNGETEFEHVMMKMMPDAYGTTVNLEDRVPFAFDGTVDLAGTNVEEWDDLGVVVWLQHEGSKEVFQSAYSIEEASFATDATLSNLSLNGTTIENFDPATFEYIVNWSGDLPEITAETNDGNAIAIVVPAQGIPGTALIDVFAEDLTTHNQYLINFDFGAGLDNQKQEAVTAFPNPSNGKVYISGVTNAEVRIYNTSGSLISSFEDFNANYIDLSEFDDGIYMMEILSEGHTYSKKINLIK